MRTLSYRLELDAGNGYVISNASTSWEAMPDIENLGNAPIKLSVLPTRTNGATENIEQYFVLNNQDENVSPDFRVNYVKALYGDSYEWKLVGVNIAPISVSLMFANEKTGSYEFLYVTDYISDLKIKLEVPYSNSCEYGVYILDISETVDSRYRWFIRVTEYENQGHRTIDFNSPYCGKCQNSNWFYVYVVEYR